MYMLYIHTDNRKSFLQLKQFALLRVFFFGFPRLERMLIVFCWSASLPRKHRHLVLLEIPAAALVSLEVPSDGLMASLV